MGNPKEAKLEEQQAPLLPQYSDDSDTIIGDEKIYTPPSTASNSGESQPNLHVEAVEDSRENDRLLSSPPPGYRDTPRCQTGDVKVDIKDDSIVKADVSPDVPGRRCRGRGRFCRWWKERCQRRRLENGQCRGRSCCMKMLVALKVVFIVWVSLWLVRWATVGFMRRHHRHHHNYHNHDDSGHGCHSNSSREIVVRERTGSIYGIYPLYDLLDLETRTGSVYVTVIPQPADPNDPLRPAKISIKSRSGNISVRFKMPAPAAAVDAASPKNELDSKAQLDMLKAAYLEEPAMNHASWQVASSLPPRPYEIDIQTRSGNIFAVVGFSTHASFSTRTGTISAHLTPLVFENTILKDSECKDCDDVSIRTHTRSGNVWLSVTEPSFIASEKRENAPEGTANAADGKHLDTRKNHHNRPNKWDRILEALNRKPSIAEPKPCSRSGLKASSYHTSRWSGNMAISYPHSWAGNVLAKTRSPGHIFLRGDGLEVTDRSGKGKELVGTKMPTVGRDDKMSWWGSEGNMDVSINVRRASVEFKVRD
ncbi:hypothetical protein McanMca71_007043 [Microsporum canis]|uniref:Uncharacterized protein n=1 Tax=Arthroderma otae (strain ATCC MYA-4605 / CBS 113480) TaxID=554155 RepID=C5FE43_ARTOC|nr:conserved hypothetical protein [Microsporum canis CBS 113480]EEQ28077.1 conserved hypothetical protein [Microsporum canis CBS 113480]